MARQTSRFALLLALLCAFALRLHGLTLQEIWWDEARNIDVAMRPFVQIAGAPELDIHPPLYFWLLHAWGLLVSLHSGMEPAIMAFAARFLSVWAGAAGLALLYQLARLATAPLAALCATAIAALSPFWLAESQETRMYTVGFALLMAAAAALMKETKRIEDSRFRICSTDPQSSIFVLLFAIFSALALLTHYNALFILAAWYLWWGMWALLQQERRRRLRRVVVSGLATILLAAPAAPIALRQIPTYANPNLVVPSLQAYLQQNWQAYLAGYAFTPALLNGKGNLWLWLILILFVAGLAWAIASPMGAGRPPQLSIPNPQLSFLLVWLLGGLGLYYMAVLDRGAFNVRYSSFVTPALYALLGAAMAGWGMRWKALTGLALAIVVMGQLPALRADLYDPAFGREDVSGVVNWLRQNVRPGDQIFVDEKYPFGFYYQRYAMDPVETPRGQEVAPARYLFVDINTIDQRLNQWAGDARRVFWVQWFESDTDPRRAVAFLLDKEGRRAGEEWFRGYSIDWWELKPPNHFALAPNLTPVRFVFSPAVETVEVSLPQGALSAGAKVPAAIRWRRVEGGTVDRPLKARVALYAGEARLAQSDQRLLNDRHLLPAEWSFVERPLNVYMLETPPDLPAGSYDLRLLVYDADTLESLTLVDDAGNPAGVEATLGAVTIVSIN